MVFHIGGPANTCLAPEQVAAKPLQQVNYKFDRSLRAGDLRKEVNGPTITFFFNPGTKTSRSAYSRSHLRAVLATAYSAKEPGLSDHVSTGRISGLKARRGVIAVDPTVIPYGTAMFVEGYGYGVAADCGSAIKGNHIDLCFNTVGECRKWGKRKVTAHIFKEHEFEWKTGRKKPTRHKHASKTHPRH